MSSPLHRELRGIVRPPLGLVPDAALLRPRRERRQRTLRTVELTPYPRLRIGQVARVGVALDESDSGLCVALDAPLRQDTLVRVVVRDLDGLDAPSGPDALDALWRVVWCEPDSKGGYAIGMTLVPQSAPRALEVRHARRRVHIAVEGQALTSDEG